MLTGQRTALGRGGDRQQHAGEVASARQELGNVGGRREQQLLADDHHLLV
jgi:hypothetical protein